MGVCTVTCSVAATGIIALAVGPHLSAQTPSAPAAGWTLDQVLTAAMKQHPLVEQAAARVAAAQGSRQTAGVLPNPVATYFVENARFPGEGPLPGLPRETSIYGTMPLDPLLRRSARIAEADADVRAAQASQTAARRAVALDAARAYYRLALAQAAADALRENRADLDQLLTYLRTRVAQGANPEADLIRTQVEQDRLDTDRAIADVEIIRARAELRPFVGGEVAPPDLRASAPPPLASLTLEPLAVWSARALAQRPDLVAARAKVEAAAGSVAVEKAGVMKELGASFGVKRTGDTNGMIAGVGISVPVFDRNQGEIQRATADRLAAEQDVAWLERTIAAEVEGELQAVTRLSAQARTLEAGFLRRAEESRQIAIGAYQEGAATLLQVIDASRTLSDARLTYARAIVAVDQSLFELGLAAGDDPSAAARRGHTDPSTHTSPVAGGVR